MKTVDQQISDVMQKKVYAVQENLMRETAQRVLRNVTLQSPVDTGYFRYSWNMSAANPDFSHEPREKDKQYPMPDIDAKISAAFAGYDGKKTVYITNGLPYAVRLNEGWSKQAPSNFVEKAVMLSTRQATAAVKRGVQ